VSRASAAPSHRERLAARIPGLGDLASPTSVVVRGARTHNLRGIDVEIPRDALVVITGPSGSGKSSLAFDTIYAEGQRRYVESLSTYARQFLDQMSKPDVESIEGLSPALSIEQRGISSSPRSTVGTVTEIADYLRLLYSRAGEPHCPRCGQPISSQSVEEMCEHVLSLGEGTRVQLLAPIVRGRKGSYRKEIDDLRRRGYVRARIDGEMVDLDDDLRVARQARHDIDVVVDRLIVKESVRGRLAESLATALELADGLVVIDLPPGRGGASDTDAKTQSEGRSWLLSRSNACADCGISLPELAPRLFSFNNPAGACPGCGGTGVSKALSPDLVVPDKSLPLREAIAPWQAKRTVRYYRQLLGDVARHLGVELDTPWQALPARARKAILHGTDDDVPFSVGLRPTRSGRPRKTEVPRPFAGVLDDLARRESDKLDRYRVASTCPDCGGARLREEARSVRVAGLAIHELCALSIGELANRLESLEGGAGYRGRVGERVIAEIRERLTFLCDVGLDYLSLDRPSATLSGGEAQRIRLATQVGSRLLGVLYILDEPSIGLHARDHARLLSSLERLRDMGNSVLVVEHDEATIRAADHVIDIGPGAGVHGGAVVATGTPASLSEHPESPTGAYLSGRRSIALPSVRRDAGGRYITLSGCRGHNLKNVTLELPLGVLTVVTGVSGSGKSTLIGDTLHRALAAQLHGAEQPPAEHDAIGGLDEIDKVIDVDQAPIGRTPRSNAATYSGAFGGIRQLFARVPEARMRGYEAGRFSFNVPGGRCEACDGDGSLRVEMSFLPDLFVTCEVCRGRRYNRPTLEITYKEKNIADVLEMTVEEALRFMENVPSVRRPLQALHDVGLDYLILGQAATTLSGGEAQRVKLAKELARRDTGRTLYLLDEPTTGLHFADVENLVGLLGRLVERGNTVVVIEHHLDVIKCADHVVDLGPLGGEQGGEIVVAGTPEEVAACDRSHTGQVLSPLLRSA
jgi:excinuclease ABC subunit A